MDGVHQIRVLEVLASRSLAGESAHVAALVAGLAPERFEIHLACSPEAPLADQFDRASITTHLLRTPGWLNWHACWQLRRIVSEARIDLVHVHGNRAGLAALLAARTRRAAYLCTVHGWEWLRCRDPISVHLIRAIEGMVTRRADLVVCLTPEDLVAGIRLGLVDPTRSRLIPDGAERSGRQSGWRPGDRPEMSADVAAIYEALVSLRTLSS